MSGLFADTCAGIGTRVVKHSRNTTRDLSARALEKGPPIGAIDVKGHSYGPNYTQAGSEVVGNKYPKSFSFILPISARVSPLAKSNLKLKRKASCVVHSAEGCLQGHKTKTEEDIK